MVINKAYNILVCSTFKKLHHLMYHNILSTCTGQTKCTLLCKFSNVLILHLLVEVDTSRYIHENFLNVYSNRLCVEIRA